MKETAQLGQLCLENYKNALRGEICSLIGHNPDAAELAQMEIYATDYIADCATRGKGPDLTGISFALLKCKQEQFIQCVECGDYFLPREINGETSEHCLGCRPYLCDGQQ